MDRKGSHALLPKDIPNAARDAKHFVADTFSAS